MRDGAGQTPTDATQTDAQRELPPIALPLAVRMLVLVALVITLAVVASSIIERSDRPAGPFGGPPRDPRPNVILIMVDTLRADGLGVYGNPRRASPNIDAMARGGIVFERAYAQAPWTAPSVASFFTGSYQSVHQVRRHHQQGGELSVLDARFTTLAELFLASGYRTAAFSSQAWILPETGFAQGFEQFHVVSGIEDPYEIDHVLASGLAWLDHNRKGAFPFFLYLHVLPPHSPYAPPPPYDQLWWHDGIPPTMQKLESLDVSAQWDALLALGKPRGMAVDARDVAYLRARYDGEVSYVDWWIGALRRQLRAWGVLDRTLLILTSDHGENFAEHGLFGHAQRVYNPELAIPLVMSHPKLFPEGRSVPDVVESIDLLPTLADLIGAPRPAHAQGVSLLDTAQRRGRAYSEGTNLKEYKLQERGWSLIVSADFERWELYDLESDPGETHDLYAERPRVAERMARELLAQYRACLDHPFRSARGKTTELEPDQLERLRAMGYVD